MDKVAPLSTFINNKIIQKDIPKSIKTFSTKDIPYIKNFKRNPTSELKSNIGELDLFVRIHFVNSKRKDVRRGIVPGTSKTLWKAVHIAKDTNYQTLPNKLSLNSVDVPCDDRANAFVKFFDS